MAIITADVEYVSGHLRYGHFEMELEGEALEDFKNMSKDEQRREMQESGDLLIDDYRVYDYGDLYDCEIGE